MLCFKKDAYGLQTDSKKSRKIIAKTTRNPADNTTLEVIEMLSERWLLEIIVVEIEHANKNKILNESVTL
ncbi:hypothetical protein [Acinetobacter sp. ULE_I064]|jgi:hypothetical protein|uniref:hypothetical protein n=1 Tax=Acinetobacter sp. ULE_I064 TaxID=3373071 RepID=UPI003AF48A1F